MNMPLQYAYLGSILIFGLTWPIFFIIRKDLRRKLLTTSLLGSIAGPISQLWYLQDYWHPRYTLGKFGPIEDLLFAFFLCGFTAVIVNIITKTKSEKIPNWKSKLYRLIIPAVILLGSLLILTNILKINSIYASDVGFILLAIFIWIQRKDLIKYSLLGALVWLLAIGPTYNILLLIWPTFIDKWWLWGNISSIRIFHVPIEEYLWFTTWGLVGSIIYEWIDGYRFKRINAKH